MWLLLQVGGLSVDKVDRMELVMWMGYLPESELSFEQAPEQDALSLLKDTAGLKETWSKCVAGLRTRVAVGASPWKASVFESGAEVRGL